MNRFCATHLLTEISAQARSFFAIDLFATSFSEIKPLSDSHVRHTRAAAKPIVVIFHQFNSIRKNFKNLNQTMPSMAFHPINRFEYKQFLRDVF